MDVAINLVWGKGHSAKIYLTQTFKNFTKFFTNKIYENLRNFHSSCENIKHCE